MLHKLNLPRTTRLIITFLFTSFISFISLNSLANTVIPVPIPQQPVVTPGAPNIDAEGFILIDANSGKVLAEKNADTRMPPASLTKLMSLYIISTALKSGSIHATDKVRISKKAWQTGGSRMFVKAGSDVPVQDLMQGIIVVSGNDASVALAEYIAGTENAFADIMNAQAKNLGMNNSHFTDSTGMPNPNHYSTPRDLALLAQGLTKNFPEDYRLFSEKWFNYNGIRQPNRNRLLWRYQYADGLKTGHTDEAGYCLVASALKDGMRLISVVMGAPSDEVRTSDSMSLLAYGYRFFETHKVFDGATALTQARVWKGQQKEIGLGLNEDFYVTLPAGQYKNIKTNIQVEDSIKAPVTKGQVCGTVQVILNKQIFASQPLIALADNEKGGIWRRVIDAMHMGFHKIFSKSHEQANNG